MEVQLTQGKVAQIDDADWPLVSAHRWRAALIYTRWYAVASVDGNNNTYLHRFLTGAPRGIKVNHIDGSGLNCQRTNMRLATRKQNAENLRTAHQDSTTGVRGVWLGRNGKYRVAIGVNGRSINLGSYLTLTDAEQVAIAGRKRYMTHAPECTEKAG